MTPTDQIVAQPEPRKKHSHRCRKCGAGVYCYKKTCTLPQRLDECRWCKPTRSTQ